MNTASAHNDPLTGSIELDDRFYRRTPNYDPTEQSYTLRELFEIGKDYMEIPTASFLSLLEMLSRNEVERRKASDEAIRTRQEMNEEERMRRDD